MQTQHVDSTATHAAPLAGQDLHCEPERRARPEIRKIFHAWGVAIAVGLLSQFVLPARGQDAAAPNATPSLQRDDVDAAIDRGIAFLLTKQRDDGAISDGQNDTALTSLAIMSLASIGTSPAQLDDRGKAMGRAMDYVLGDKVQDEQGYFGSHDNSRMYGHGITTLMLTEMHGMGVNSAQDARIAAAAQRAIELILAAQDHPKSPLHRGGWRYTPDAIDADLSVSIWQLMALRSAKNDGLEVPQAAIERAIAYLRRSASTELDSQGRPATASCGFSYTPGDPNATFAMTAAGLLAMQVCGQYDSPLVVAATKWLEENPPKWDSRYFFYGTYYYAQAMYQRGGQPAVVSARRVKELLLEHQRDDGSWQGGGEEQGHGPVYATSLAILSLSVKYHYLPIYQR
jgi:hypothetical protein